MMKSWHESHACAAAAACITDPDADPAGAGSVTNYRRGLNPCVFVPWEGVATSVLNLPVKDMDFWMPG